MALSVSLAAWGGRNSSKEDPGGIFPYKKALVGTRLSGWWVFFLSICEAKTLKYLLLVYSPRVNPPIRERLLFLSLLAAVVTSAQISSSAVSLALDDHCASQSFRFPRPSTSGANMSASPTTSQASSGSTGSQSPKQEFLMSECRLQHAAHEETPTLTVLTTDYCRSKGFRPPAWQVISDRRGTKPFAFRISDHNRTPQVSLQLTHPQEAAPPGAAPSTSAARSSPPGTGTTGSTSTTRARTPPSVPCKPSARCPRPPDRSPRTTNSNSVPLTAVRARAPVGRWAVFLSSLLASRSFTPSSRRVSRPDARRLFRVSFLWWCVSAS